MNSARLIPQKAIAQLTMRKKISSLFFFIILTLFIVLQASSSYAENINNSTLYYFPGWDYPGCGTVTPSYGRTVEEVARKEIQKQNLITNCNNCRSPATLVSVNEETGMYTEKSLCSGQHYTYQVLQITLPYDIESNLGSSSPPSCSP